MTNKPMLSVELQLTEQQELDLMRFYATCEDSQPYDVPKDRMKSLARLGLVRSLGFSRYEFTDVGCAAIENLRAILDKPAYPNRLCHADYTTHPYICGCLKGDEEAQRRFDEHHSKGAQHHGDPVAVFSIDESGYRARVILDPAKPFPPDGALLYAEPAAQHQGEPVALQHMAVSEGGVLRWMTGRKMQDCELYAMPDGSAIRAQLFFQQPVRVMVVIPERQSDPGPVAGLTRKWAEGWNDCRAETARLNGVKP